MFHFKKKAHTDQLFSPAAGKVVELSTVSDPVFAQKMMGDGFAVTPDFAEDKIVAPISGTVTVAQGHAFGITRDDGLEFLVHIGIDTVSLKGAPFKLHAKKGKYVEDGDKMVTVDWDQIKAKKLDPTVMVLITNSKTNLDELKMNYQTVGLDDVVGTATAKKNS